MCGDEFWCRLFLALRLLWAGNYLCCLITGRSDWLPAVLPSCCESQEWNNNEGKKTKQLCSGASAEQRTRQRANLERTTPLSKGDGVPIRAGPENTRRNVYLAAIFNIPSDGGVPGQCRRLLYLLRLDAAPRILVIILFYDGITDADIQRAAAPPLFKAAHRPTLE